MASESGSASTERELVARIAKLYARSDRRVELGIGDDAAVVRTTPRTVVACDPVVEGVHFTRGDPMHLVGRKAVNRNLSDLAAMGARPRFILSSILFPDWIGKSDRDRLLRGIQKAAAAADCSVIGGDVARAPGPLVVTVTAMGEAPKKPLLRSALRAGDRLHVTGPLGGSLAGRHLRFAPRTAEGEWLAAQRGVRAAIDISDGLLLDLSTMLLASGSLGAVLDVPAIPVTRAAKTMAVASADEPVFHALTDGEDHELLFGVRGALPDEPPLTARARRPIGEVTASPGIFLRGRDGLCRPAEPVGYQHDV